MEIHYEYAIKRGDHRIIVLPIYNMEALEALLTRRSCKSYRPEMPSEEVLNKILEAGTFAPSGRGAQAAIIVAVTNKEVRDQLSQMNAEILGTTADPFYGAPVVLVVLADRTKHTYLYDGSAVMENLQLAAHALGLGSCWIHRAKQEFDSEAGKALLKSWGIEGDYEGIAHCIVGYPDKLPTTEKPRKDDYIRYVR
ncbi:nitroreductase [Alloprevotella tannerae]|uniref:nitroreductase family protein n=1 Tax=Alloprevotella tannerae TaxID=76122 RepID=UPI0028ED651B|nr:nitroreductase [Alloprevotella tannerae]